MMEMQTNPTPNRTPANAVNHRQELIPMPLRVATRQYERLDAARARTGLSIQEHARRALDLYLAVIEREAIDLGLMPERFGMPPVQPPPPAPVDQGAGRTRPRPAARPKVVKR